MEKDAKKEYLERIMKALRERGCETFDEMILYQAENLEKAYQSMKRLKEESEDRYMEIKERDEEIKRLRQTNQELLFITGNQKSVADQPDSAIKDPYYQTSTITFNGDPHIESIEVYYRKDH